MNLWTHTQALQPAASPLHQSIVVKYPTPTSAPRQGALTVLDSLKGYISRTSTDHTRSVRTIIPEKVLDLSVQRGTMHLLLYSNRRLKFTLTAPDASFNYDPFLIEYEDDFITNPTQLFNGPEYLVDQTKVAVVYNSLLRPTGLLTKTRIDEGPLPLYTALIFCTPQFLAKERLFLDATIQLTNCAFNNHMVVMSLPLGRLLFVDREQLMPRNNIIDSDHYSYYGLISYSHLASRLMREGQSTFHGDFSFRESIRILSISPPTHIPFLLCREADLVLILPLGCIFIFTWQPRHDLGTGILTLSYATVALPFVRHDLPNKSFRVTHYAASMVSAALQITSNGLLLGYVNSILQYYCWDIDSSIHPLDGIDLDAGKIVYLHAGTLASTTASDSNEPDLKTRIKVVIAATLGSSLFFIIQLFPKLTLFMTVFAPNRFVSSGKLCSPTAGEFSSLLLYTTIDESLAFVNFPKGYLFCSGLVDNDIESPYHGLHKSTVQKLTSSLQNVTHGYDSDASGSDLNLLNERHKATLPTFLLSSSDKETSSVDAVKSPIQQTMKKLDVLQVKSSKQRAKHNKLRANSMNKASPNSRLFDFNDTFSFVKDLDYISIPPGRSETKSSLTDLSDSPPLEPMIKPICRPFEQVIINVQDKTPLARIQDMYSAIGAIHRQKLDINERVAYDDSLLPQLSLVKDTHALIKDTAYLRSWINTVEFRKYVSPELDIQRLLISSRNLNRAMGLLQRNEHIFRSNKTNIQPHIRSAYFHLKKLHKYSNSIDCRHDPLIRQSYVGPQREQVHQPQNASSLPSRQMAQSSIHSKYPTRHAGGLTSDAITDLAYELLFNTTRAAFDRSIKPYRNVWSPSIKPSYRQNKLKQIVIQSRARQTDISNSFNDLSSALRSRVLEKPRDWNTGSINCQSKRSSRQFYFRTQEHTKIMDKELLKDLQRFKALNMGYDITGKIIRDKNVITALLSGDNASENLKDIIQITDPANHLFYSLDDIVSIGTTVTAVLESKDREFTPSKHARPGEPQFPDDVLQRLLTPTGRFVETTTPENQESRPAYPAFGTELMNKLLHNFNYRLNKRCVRSGINGMITIDDEFERIIILRRSASLPTSVTLNSNRIELATKLDSALGYEMGISRWDSAANRDYRGRILSIGCLSDPDSALYESMETPSFLSEKDSGEEEYLPIRLNIGETRRLSAFRRTCSAPPGEHIELEKIVFIPRAYSAKLRQNVIRIELTPLTLEHYLPHTSPPEYHVSRNPTPINQSPQLSLPSNINELDELINSPDLSLQRLSSASYESDISDELLYDVHKNTSEQAIDKSPSIFGIVQPFDPANYMLSSTFFPDIILRTTLQQLKTDSQRVHTTGMQLQYLLRDDCSQIFKATRALFHYANNHLTNYCLQTCMFCPNQCHNLSIKTARDISFNKPRRAQSFDQLEQKIFRKKVQREKSNAFQQKSNLLLQNCIDYEDDSSSDLDLSFEGLYDYFTMPTNRARHRIPHTLQGHPDNLIGTSSLAYVHHGPIPTNTQEHPNLTNTYASELRTKAFSTYSEALAMERIARRQRLFNSDNTALMNFKELFTRELYEDWARIYRHNVLRTDTLYDNQFEVTMMKPTFPLRYNVLTNKTQLNTMITNIMNSEENSLAPSTHSVPVITKVQLLSTSSDENNTGSLLDEMQVTLGSHTDTQSPTSSIPHHYSVPPKPPYYNPRIPILDHLDKFYDPHSIVPLEPLFPEGEDGICLQIGVYTPYGFCIKHPDYVDNEKLTTILNPVAYLSCKDVILTIFHAEAPHINIESDLRQAGYAPVGSSAGLIWEYAPSIRPDSTSRLHSNSIIEYDKLQQSNVPLDGKSAFDIQIKEFINSFFTLPKLSSSHLVAYHTGLYSHQFYTLASQIKSFSPKVRCSMITVGQAIKDIVRTYFSSFTPVQRRIINQAIARGVKINLQQLNYVPYSFLQLLLLYSSALSMLKLMQGQKHTHKSSLINSRHTFFITPQRRLADLLETQFPIDPPVKTKGLNKKNTYGKASSHFPSQLFFNFYSVQDVLTYENKAFVRYMLIIVHYVCACNLEGCISSFVDYQVKKILKQNAHFVDPSDPYHNVVELYDRMAAYICANYTMNKIALFSTAYEKLLRKSIFKMAGSEVAAIRPSSFLTYFGPKFNPTGFSLTLMSQTEKEQKITNVCFKSATLAIVYDDTDMDYSTVQRILSKYALTCMLKDTSMHIHGVYAAIHNHFAAKTNRHQKASDPSSYFPEMVNNLVAVPLSMLLLIYRLEELEYSTSFNIEKAMLRHKLRLLALDLYTRKIMDSDSTTMKLFVPLAHVYVHFFRIPQASTYSDYSSMVLRRQQIFHKILYDICLTEMRMRIKNNFIIMQPKTIDVLGISRSDVLFNFFSGHCYPVFIPAALRHGMSRKMVIGESVYSNAYDQSVTDSMPNDFTAIEPESSQYEHTNEEQDTPIVLSWYSSLYHSVIKSPLTLGTQRSYKNRHSYDLYEDHMAGLDQEKTSNFVGDPFFEALLAKNDLEAIRHNIEARRDSLEAGTLDEAFSLYVAHRTENSLTALGRSIFRNRVLGAMKGGFSERRLEQSQTQSITEYSSAEELCTIECFANPVEAGERLVSNTTAQLLQTCTQAENVALWAAVAEREEMKQEYSCTSVRDDTNTKLQRNRMSYDSTYELRKAFTDIRIPRYRSTSVLSHITSKRIGTLISKPLPAIRSVPNCFSPENKTKETTIQRGSLAHLED